MSIIMKVSYMKSNKFVIVNPLFETQTKMHLRSLGAVIIQYEFDICTKVDNNKPTTIYIIVTSMARAK
jgi:hypothetical protein